MRQMVLLDGAAQPGRTRGQRDEELVGVQLLAEIARIVATNPAPTEPATSRQVAESALRTTALQSAENPDLRAVESFIERYRRVPYHAVHVVHPGQSREKGELPFLMQFFGVVNRLGADTLNVYFLPSELRQKPIRESAAEAVPTLHAVLASHRKRSPAEDTLIVWDRDRFAPRAIGLGRFVPATRIAVIASLVTALESGMSLQRAASLAMRQPADYAVPEVPALLDRSKSRQLRDLSADLRRKDREDPQAGYAHLARIIEQIDYRGRVAQAFARARLTAALTLAGLGALHTLANDAPDTYQRIVEIARHVNLVGTEHDPGRAAVPEADRSDAEPADHATPKDTVDVPNG